MTLCTSGILIILTVFMAYMWICVISLFQIYTLIKKENYKKLYGENPLVKPSKQIKNDLRIPMESTQIDKVQTVNLYSTSNFVQSKPLKRIYNNKTDDDTTPKIYYNELYIGGLKRFN